MPQLFDIRPLLPALRQGELILTPNRRLAAKAMAAYGHEQAQQQQCWPTARISSMEGWLQQLWDELQDSQPLGYPWLTINSRQELLIWEQLIAEDPESSPLIKPRGAAQQCQQAYTLLSLWQQHPESDEYRQWASQPDHFAHWYQLFERYCQQHQLLPQVKIAEQLIKAFQLDQLPKTERLHLLGFQDIPPLQQQLIAAASLQHDHFTYASINESVTTLSLPNREQELRTAAKWAAQVIASDPGASIAIVIPDLRPQRDQVERIFRQYFDSDYRATDRPPAEPPFNLSMGVSLASTALIHSALQILSWLIRPVALNEISQLLHSPFIPGFDEELAARVALEQKLRRRGHDQYRLQQCLYLAEQLTPLPAINIATTDQPQLDLLTASPTSKDESEGCPQLVTWLQQLLETPRPAKQTISHWARWFQQLLEHIGWPGSRSCSSLEYQQLSQWYELLNQMQRFDLIAGQVNLASALNRLTQETQAAIFQPKTEDSALQILGPLEAAGLQFTHVWMTGLSDNQWPPAPSPNPMLPVGLQRQYHMPHASAERELSFARQLLTTYISNASQVIFSYPCWDEDQPLRPSGLIQAYPSSSVDGLRIDQASFNPFWGTEREASEVIGQQPLNWIDTTTAPAVTAQELSFIRGGSALLKQQAACPFSAFAIHRLGARPLETPGLGLGAADRGNLLHSALEHFWNEVKTQGQLLSMDEAAKEDRIQQSCYKAIQPYRKQGAPWMGASFWQIETDRLFQLLSAWLELEAERQPFKVFATEDALQTQLCGLELKLRIDRIDQLRDGSFLLIDYKSGSPTLAQWTGERLKEPQLPLYAVTSRKTVAALSFAIINAKQQGFRGLCAADEFSDTGITPLSAAKGEFATDWPAQIASWRQHLEQLASGFMQGQSAVDPLDAQAYQYTALEPLARLYEINSAELMEAEHD